MDDGASPQAMTEDGEPIFDPDGMAGQQGQADQSSEESWLGGNEGEDPWSGGGNSGAGGGGDAGEGGGGWADTLSDFFGGE